MPVNVAYMRYVLSGSLPGGERWACGFAGLVPANYTSAQATLNEAGSANWFSTLTTAVRNINVAATTIDTFTVYHYLPNATAADSVGTGTVGLAGTGTSSAPNQTALVTTFRSGLATGRGRGRAYWPATGPGAFTGGLIASTLSTALNNALISTMIGVRGVVVSETAGNVQVVTSVTTDNRTDVIRARAARLSPLRASGVVPPP